MGRQKFFFRINWNIFIIMSFMVLITALFTFIQPLKYASSSRFLVVQNYGKDIDPYAASKNTQYVSDILAKVIYSTSFLNEVLDSDFNVDRKRFSNEEDKKEEWEKTVQAKANSDTGIISVNVFHTDKGQAEAISNAISYVLKTKHSLYHGGGENISILVIDKPITTKWPVKPNIAVNLILALFFGIVSGVAFIYFFPDYDIKIILQETFYKWRGKMAGAQVESALGKRDIAKEKIFYPQNEFKNIKNDQNEEVIYTSKDDLFDDF